MRLLERLGVHAPSARIDWEITPVDTYGLFECRGPKRWVKSKEERYYYFYIDNWQPPARLCLMERGIRLARVLARIEAPQKLIDRCVAQQGNAPKDKNYAIDHELRQWLEEHVLETEDDARVIPVQGAPPPDQGALDLPGRDDPLPLLKEYRLRSTPEIISEGQIPGIIGSHNFFEMVANPGGSFQSHLVDNGDNLTVTDLVTNVTWQRGGGDLGFYRRTQAWIADLNRTAFAGYSDWRLPTIEEAMALLQPEKNQQGLHVHDCFSVTQAFIYTADRRMPGGYWFVDFRHARVFWAAGTFAGGFGRACRGGGLTA